MAPAIKNQGTSVIKFLTKISIWVISPYSVKIALTNITNKLTFQMLDIK
jgi:hypothetical protein